MADTTRFIPPLGVEATRTQGVAEPRAVLEEERKYLQRRREAVGDARKDPAALSALAISGGGIRSATFALGLLQALAGANLLKRFDYLSTVSGGGYIGTSLVWWLSGKAGNPKPFGLSAGDFPFGVDPPHPPSPAQDSPEQQSVLRFLRQRGEYLTPGSGITLTSGIAAVLRGAVLNLTLLIVVLLAAICVVEWISLWLMSQPGWLADTFNLTLAPWMERLLTAIAGSTVAVYVQYALYLLAPVAAAGLALVPLVAGTLYAVSLWAAGGSDSRFRYRMGRLLDMASGSLIWFILGLIVLGSLPFIHLAILRGARAFTDLATVGSTLAAAAGIVSGLLEWLRRKGLGAALPAWAAGLVSAVFLYGLLWLAYSIVRARFPHGVAAGEIPAWWIAVGAVSVLLSVLLNINLLSLHQFYRDRLMEAFHPSWSSVAALRTQATEGANQARLADMLRDAKTPPPYPLINANVVLVHSKDLTLRERGGDNFVLAPLHCGGSAIGWQSTERFTNGHLTLPTAMAISGAAANPNAVGLLRSRAVSLVMSILNLRLGYWAAHPRYARFLRWPSHIVPGLSQVISSRLLGFHERALFLQLSDGGHFENLALYEPIRRGARLILLSDGAADPKFAFEDFQQFARRVAIDFGATVEFDSGGFTPLLRRKKLDWPQKMRGAKAGHIVGTVHYADGSEGTLIYVKATVVDGLPPETLGYAAAHPDFPHQTTADQWFDEEQFEAYRQLGHHLGTRMIAEAGLKARLGAL